MADMGHIQSFGDVRLNVRFARKRTQLGDLWTRRYRVETEGFLSTVVTVTPNFALLEMSHPEVASLVAAMLQARDAVERRSRGRKRRLSKTDEASAPRIEAVPARCWALDDSR